MSANETNSEITKELLELRSFVRTMSTYGGTVQSAQQLANKLIDKHNIDNINESISKGSLIR